MSGEAVRPGTVATRRVYSGRIVQLDVETVRFAQRLADRLLLRGEERVRHAAADQDRVALVEQVVDHEQFVRDLGAAEDRDQRPFGLREHASERVDLRLEQPARRRRQELGDLADRALGAVRRAERVVDEHVAELRVGRAQRWVRLLLTRVEAHVLEQDHAAARGARHNFLDRRSRALVELEHLAAE